MADVPARAREVHEFWFGALDPDGLPSSEVTARWFRGGKAFDAECERRFGEDVGDVCKGGCRPWEALPAARIALVVLLDQLTRNVHRGTALAFAGDARALELAKASVDRGDDALLLPIERYFLYMPFEHAEDAGCQRRACELFERLARDEGRVLIFSQGVEWAQRHRLVIDRFGRFPSRNAALRRETTPEEAAFLAEHSSGF